MFFTERNILLTVYHFGYWTFVEDNKDTGAVVPVPKHHTMKAYGKQRCKAPCSINLCIRWR
jgi:hypothetical protein